MVGPSAKRGAVGWLVDAQRASLRRACRLVDLSTGDGALSTPRPDRQSPNFSRACRPMRPCARDTAIAGSIP